MQVTAWIVSALLLLVDVSCYKAQPAAIRSIDGETKLGSKCAPELDYGAHCICDFWPYEIYNIYCNVTSSQDFIDIASVFSASPIVDHWEIKFTLFASNLSIPKHALGDKTAKTVIVDCMNGTIESIDSQAFVHSEATVSAFELFSCNLNSASFDFKFLAQFRVLEMLRISRSSLTLFKNVPFLPHVQTVELNAMSGLQSWYPPELTPILNTVTINGVTDTSPETMEDIIETLLYYEYSLRRLYLIDLGLTRVPAALRNFTSLNVLDLSSNRMEEFPAMAFDLRSSLDSLILENIPVRAIHPQAFSGNYRSTTIRLVYNNLSYFEKDVFRDLMVDMMQAYGFVYLYGSPIKCNDCHLGWLVNDERYLLARLQEGTCDNMTNFRDLDSKAYDAKCAKSSATSSLSTALAIVIVTVLLSSFLL